MTQAHKQAFGKTDALLLLMALIWGVNFSIVKFGTTVFSPLAFTGLRVFLENPLIGVGPGGYAFWYPRFGGFVVGGMASPLNMWLYFLTDVGILGVIPFALFVANIARRSYRSVSTHPLVIVYLWSLVSFLVLHSTNDMWYIEIFWFELAMMVVLISSPKFVLRNAA